MEHTWRFLESTQDAAPEALEDSHIWRVVSTSVLENCGRNILKRAAHKGRVGTERPVPSETCLDKLRGKDV